MLLLVLLSSFLASRRRAKADVRGRDTPGREPGRGGHRTHSRPEPTPGPRAQPSWGRRGKPADTPVAAPARVLSAPRREPRLTAPHTPALPERPQPPTLNVVITQDVLGSGTGGSESAAISPKPHRQIREISQHLQDPPGRPLFREQDNHAAQGRGAARGGEGTSASQQRDAHGQLPEDRADKGHPLAGWQTLTRRVHG